MKKLKIKEEHFKRFERRLNFYFCLKNKENFVSARPSNKLVLVLSLMSISCGVSSIRKNVSLCWLTFNGGPVSIWRL